MSQDQTSKRRIQFLVSQQINLLLEKQSGSKVYYANCGSILKINEDYISFALNNIVLMKLYANTLPFREIY